MKTLLIVRHAKSDWSNLHLKDFDRTLNERGMHDAPMMGKRLKEKALSIDLITSSTAIRAQQTATLIAQELPYPLEQIHWADSLYHAPPSRIYEQIFETNNTINSLLLVCHNPGITEFVNSFGTFISMDMPTCGICAFQFDTTLWETIRTSTSKLLFVDFPKNKLVI